MSKVLDGLNKEQKVAVTTTQGPLLVIAGAGTGKTTVITRRIAYLIEQKLAKPSEIIALTFTEKAAGEMEERVDILVPYGYIDTWISTFHAFGNRVLEENALDIGLPPDFKVLTKPQQILFFQQNLFRFDLQYYRPLANPTKFIEAILSFISRCKDEDISPEQYNKYVRELKIRNSKFKIEKEQKKEQQLEIKKQEELARVYEKYEQYKREAGLLDFGDQVSLTLKLFRERPGILKKYQEQFKYILVDEFQDTNWAQNELVKLLANKEGNVCVVADDDQSIYRFRGAAISNVLDFRKTYHKAKIVTLIDNYRSTQYILDSAYRLIQQNNPDRLEVQEKINKRLLSARKKVGTQPQELFCETLSQEADAVAGEIEKLTKGRKIAFKNIAVLVRANSQADPFLRSLNMKGIPHKFVGSSGLYEQPEVRVLINFLYSLADTENSLELFSLATSDLYQLPMRDAIAASSFARRQGRGLHWIFSKIDSFDEEELILTKEGREIIRKIVKDLQESREKARKENAGTVLYEYLKKVGYLKYLSNEKNVQAQVKIPNIERFFDKIRQFISLSNNQSISTFLEWLEIMRAAGDDPATVEYDPDLNAVNVMTVHAAKGLEFPVVFMVNLVSDLFPSRQRGEVIPLPEKLIKEVLPSGDFHMQEERRLFYVGVTRAKDKLYFSWSRDMGGKRIKKISPFVLEALENKVAESITNRISPLARIEQFALFDSVSPVGSPELKIIRLSQGAIDDYQTCAYKYRYIHVLRLPILRHHNVVYGSALHESVAAFYRAKIGGKLLPLAKMLEVFENAWTSEGFLSIEHEEKRLFQGKKVITDFWKREVKSKDIPTFVEKEFKFPIKNNLVVGRFDRLDLKEGNARIIDFKSTESRSEEEVEKAAKDSLQLKVYALAYYKNYKKAPDFVGIYDLESGFVGGYKPSEGLLKETEKLISETGEDIRRNIRRDEFPANPKYFGRVPACNYCAYNSICPFSLTKN